MSEQDDLLQEELSSEIGRSITITQTNGQEITGILTAVAMNRLQIKTATGRRTIFLSLIGGWELLDDEQSRGALVQSIGKVQYKDDAGLSSGQSSRPFHETQSVEFSGSQEHGLKGKLQSSPQQPATPYKPSLEKNVEHEHEVKLLPASDERTASYPPEIEARLALIEAIHSGKIQGVQLSIQPPDFFVSNDDLKSQLHKQAWGRIKQKYEYAARMNELGSQFGRVKPLIQDLKELIAQVPLSAGLRRHLAYLYYITGAFDDALQLYKEAVLLTPGIHDWHNLAVLARMKEENLSIECYALGNLFRQVAPTSAIEAWFVYVGTIERTGDLSLLRGLHTSDGRPLSAEDEKMLLEAAIYLFARLHKRDRGLNLLHRLLQHHPVASLLREADAYLLSDKKDVRQGVKDQLQRDCASLVALLRPAPAKVGPATQMSQPSLVWSTDFTRSGDGKSAVLQGGIYIYRKSRNYGFLVGQDGVDYFFHRSAITDEELLVQLQRLREEKLAAKDYISIIFEAAQGRQGSVAINVSFQRDIARTFELATNYANEGDYGRALTQIKKVLAENPVYPNAQESYDKWREYARATSVPRGSNPYSRAKRKQLVEKDLEAAEQLFYEAIRQNDTIESAVKDLAVLLMQIKKTKEAIQVLEQNRSRMTDMQSINNLMVDALQKDGQYATAVDLLRNQLKLAKTVNRKTQIIWRLGYCYLNQDKYSEAEHWFREAIEIGPYTKSAQRNLAICLIKQKRDDEAEQLLIATLPDPQSAELLDAISRARDTGQSVPIDELSAEMSLAEYSSEISAFTRFYLDRCTYEGVPSLRVQEKSFDRNDVRRLEELATRLGTRRPRERAEYYLSAAKIIREHDDWDEEYNQLYRYLCRSFASRGDAAVIENKHLDTAREWYCEALSIYDGDRARNQVEQDAVNALIRFLFATISRAHVPFTPSGQENLNIDDSLEIIIRMHGQQDKVFDAIAYLVVRSQYAAKRILQRLYSVPTFQSMSISYLKKKGVVIPTENVSHQFFTDLWKDLQKKEQGRTRTTSIELRTTTRRLELTTASVQDSLGRLREMEADFFFELDRQRVNELQKILETMLDLCQQTAFEEQERFCNQIENRCNDLLREIEANPTKMSVESFYPIVEVIERKTKEYLEEIYVRSVPQLNLRLPADMTSYAPDANNPRIEVQIVIENKMSCSPAEAVEIIIQEDGTFFTIDNPEIKLEGSLRGGEQQIKRVPILVTEQALKSQAFSLPLYAHYRTRSGEEKQTIVTSFSINLYSSEQFERIENPYAAYASGGIVDENSMFYGRAELIDNISDAIYKARAQSKSIVIFGQKRSGKSSILHHLKKKLQQYPALLVVDLGSIGLFSSRQSSEQGEKAGINLFEQILAGILRELSYAIEDMVDAGLPPLALSFPTDTEFYTHPSPLQAFQDVLMRFKRATARTPGWNEKRIVLLIDEFSYVYGWIMNKRLSDDFMKIWKALLQKDLFSVVLAGQDVMPKFKERFPNEFGVTQDQRVSYLKDEDARKLIDEPIRIGGRTGDSRYREKAIDRVVDLTSGSPFYIQILCNRLVEYMNRHYTSLVTEADVEQVKNELIQGANPLGWDNFDNLTNSGDTSPDAISDADARAVLKAIAINSRNGPCSRSRISVETQTDINAILQDLEQRDVVEAKPGQSYVIRVGLFKEWLLAHQ
ncbi:tetratricopeptide repeat protein [Tengunoibacter tsumagoiensis]|uniref:Cold-shock protein n=1 Tax=Tengunoibacter tsumagoiensis TaxID=2014871 RepID=A0A401ZZB7_9CHLR|nr:tetratricopeptide repeat protein [Tengunoibacter tsumagoiensis]GCE12204.1 hypothetical protein KTT_20630 [Tengunoibacter tsumagoiensis]